jgi:O-acetyl-ADP-ribose deacetylase (regulator of RNase III)
MIELARGDILNCDAEAVVLSAHPTLVAGSGMSGHFHKQAGPKLEEAAKKLGPLDPGNSVVTEGFDLKIPLVVHAVAPRCIMKSQQEEQLLRETYLSVFNHEALADIESIVFPAIGVGIYRWPVDLAASLAVSILKGSPFKRTIVCLYDQENYESYRQLLA